MEVLSSDVPSDIYVMITDFSENFSVNDVDLTFSKFYQNTFFLQFNKHKTIDEIINLFLPHQISPSQVHFLTPPKKSGQNKIYFCLIQNKSEKQYAFEKLIIDFTLLRTYKIRAFIAEKAYSVTFESEDDLIRISTFIPNINFADNGQILVGFSWFDLPIVRFSNISEHSSKEEFLALVQSRSIYVQYQKTKVSDGVKITANVITANIEEGQKLITDFNFSSIYESIVYVNWFVDPDVLSKLEKYRIKVNLSNEERCQSPEFKEHQFYELMEQFGPIFRASYSSADKTGIVIFKNIEDADKVGQKYEIDFLYARGMLYNFPFGTTEEMVKEIYFKDISAGIRTVVCHNIIYQNDNRMLPYFLITCNSISSFEQTADFVENNEYQFGNIKIQPFLIQIERSLNVTKQKYDKIKNGIIDNFTLLVQKLPNDVTANQLLDLYSKYGTIQFFKLDQKQFEELSAIISFKSFEEMEIALNETNDSHFRSFRLKATVYESSLMQKTQQEDSQQKSTRKNQKKKIDFTENEQLIPVQKNSPKKQYNHHPKPNSSFIPPIRTNSLPITHLTPSSNLNHNNQSSNLNHNNQSSNLNHNNQSSNSNYNNQSPNFNHLPNSSNINSQIDLNQSSVRGNQTRNTRSDNSIRLTNGQNRNNFNRGSNRKRNQQEFRISQPISQDSDSDHTDE